MSVSDDVTTIKNDQVFILYWIAGKKNSGNKFKQTRKKSIYFKALIPYSPQHSSTAGLLNYKWA